MVSCSPSHRQRQVRTSIRGINSKGALGVFFWMTTIVVALVPPNAAAQWLPNGTPIVSAPGDQLMIYGSQTLLPDSTGGFFTTWHDYRAAPGTPVADIYLQRIDALGTPVWAVDGIDVSVAAGYELGPTMAPDGSGGVFIAWVHGVPGAVPTDLYLQRITSAGAISDGWPTGGRLLTTVPGYRNKFTLTEDGAGGAYVVWETMNYDFELQTFTGPATVSLQHVLGNGTIPSPWPPDGLFVINAQANEAYPAIAPDGSGGVVMVWTDGRTGGNSDTDLFAQRISVNAVPLWPAGGKPVCVAPAAQTGPEILSGGDGTFFVVWSDANGPIDIYGQHLTLAGDLVPGWSLAGVPICTAPGAQSSPTLARDGAGGVCVTWYQDNRAGPPNPGDVFVQRMNSGGSVATGWPINGLPVCTLPSAQEGAHLAVEGDGTLLVTWQDYRSGNWHIYAQRLLPGGSVAPGWPTDGLAVCSASGGQQAPHVVLVDPAHAVVAWNDSRGSTTDIYAQHVRLSDGAIGDHGVWTQPFPGGSLPTARAYHSAIMDPDRDRMIVFGGIATNPDIYYNDLWDLSLSGNATWHRLEPAGPRPSPRYGHSAILDPVRNRMIVFGGVDANGVLLDDVWALSLTNSPEWSMVTSGGVLGRGQHTAIYDPAENRMLIYGGNTSVPLDVWSLSLAGTPTWSQVPTGNTPTCRRYGHCALYDPKRERMLVAEGTYWSPEGCGLSGDLWALSLSPDLTWSHTTPSTTWSSSALLFAAASIYDPVRDTMVMFGGRNPYDQSWLEGAWVLPLSDQPAWRQLSPLGTRPSPRYAHSAVYDARRDRMLVFGGYDGTTESAETWALTWGTPSPTPPLAPSNLSITLLSPSRASLSWQDNSDTETGFEIQVQTDDSGIWIPAVTLPANSISWTSGTLDCGHTYEYRIRSCSNLLCSSWLSFDPLALGSCITLTPSTVTWLDTGVDLLIEGLGFDTNAEVILTPPGTPVSVHRWSDTRLHVSLDIDSSLLGPNIPEEVNIKVVSAGQESSPATLHVAQLSVPHPRQYAPTFWFAPGETWFPTSPFFSDGHGSTAYNSPQGRNDTYLALSREERKQRSTVYYFLHGDDETPINFKGHACLVYEYWLYFPFDEFYGCNAVPFNRHYHDWEKFFVFVDKNDSNVRGIAGSAHLPMNASNVYEFSPPVPPYHPLVLVELGGHATCPDRNGNGRFDVTVDVNGCAANAAWGIKDGVTGRFGLDKLYSPDVQGGEITYRLASLRGVQAVVDPRFTSVRSFWEGSQEEKCSRLGSSGLTCGGASILRPSIPTADTTFILSQPARPNDASPVVSLVQGLCSPWCWDGADKVRLAHIPIEHAWRGRQAEYLRDPRTILPNCFEPLLSSPVRRVTGFLRNQQVATRHCNLGLLVGRGSGGGSWKLSGQNSVASGPPDSYGYSMTDSTGMILFSQVRDGTYTFYWDSELTAPYEQTLAIAQGDTLLGVGGGIAVVPRDRYFTITCTVTDVDTHPIPGAQVEFMAEPDSVFLPTLTDSLGEARACADTIGTYRVEVSFIGFHQTIMGIRGSFGDTVQVASVAPFDLWDPTDSPTSRIPTKTFLRQNHPNPFNPSTVIEFALPITTYVRLDIYGVDGRMVRNLIAESLPPGEYRRGWDGLDEERRVAPSGVYTCRLRTGTTVDSRKLVLVR